MTKKLTSSITVLAVGVVSLLVVLVPAGPAQADTNHFRETSRQVAREIGCKRWYSTGGGGTTYKSGVCWLRGKRVNVITFRNRTQQRSWNAFAEILGPRHHWANGTGAIVTAKNGNRPAAVLGARLLPGKVRHG
jgi:hypothetical protein